MSEPINMHTDKTAPEQDTIDAAQLARIAAGMGADPAKLVAEVERRGVVVTRADPIEALDCSDTLKNLLSQALRFAHLMTHDNERTAVMSLSNCARLASAELYPGQDA